MNPGKKYRTLLTLALLLVMIPLHPENRPARIWASVQFNKRSVVVGEALLVTITVYTSTWFTHPPKYGEIQVPEAMMVDFQQRTGSVRKSIGNKTYPAIEKKYVVYPLKEGKHILPSLSIAVESPPEGDYKGRKQTIRSPERSFEVLPAPDGVFIDPWLTSFHVELYEQWSRHPGDLKQGDVLDRTISMKASGALAALIPPLEIPEISCGNIYVKPVSFSNAQMEQSFTGTRTETWTYLLETAGDFTLPGIEVSWYDPVHKTKESARIEAREIHIGENPNMDFLLSMQDSLQALLETGNNGEARVAFICMGLNWWQLLVVSVTGLICIYLLIRLLLHLVRLQKKHRKVASESEHHYFELLSRAADRDHPDILMRSLMEWYDRFRSDRFPPDFESFICLTGDPVLRDSYNRLIQILYRGDKDQTWPGQELFASLFQFRKGSLKEETAAQAGALQPLNPGNKEPLLCKDTLSRHAG